MNRVIVPNTLSEAKEILAGLRVYDDMQKKLGKRGRALFHRMQDGTHFCKIEFHATLGKQEAIKQAGDLYPKVFGYTPSDEELQIHENPGLGGGMKLYFDDSLLDLSFKRVETKLKK